jgi:hypothetical protein
LPISFSAFSLETVVLIERREYGTAAGGGTLAALWLVRVLLRAT